jgi:hypothetical protein
MSTAKGNAFDIVVAPVLQIMPEIWKLCASSDLPLSVEHMKVDLSVAQAIGCGYRDQL